MRVFVQGGEDYKLVTDIFRPRYEITGKLSEADTVVWTGGADLYPGLYGEKPIPGTYFNRVRDKDDIECYNYAVKNKKLLVGICRGAQLLNVMNGGVLWQDVNGHEGCIHKAYDKLTHNWIFLNSVHHQMCQVTPKAELICWSFESTWKYTYGAAWQRPKGIQTILDTEKEPEAFYYPETRSLCFQPHPEYGHKPTTDYFFELINKYKEYVPSAA
jgi:GMP synthase-like glutamine amidotransferase